MSSLTCFRRERKESVDLVETGAPSWVLDVVAGSVVGPERHSLTPHLALGLSFLWWYFVIFNNKKMSKFRQTIREIRVRQISPSC